MVRDAKRYRDCLGRTALAVPNAYDGGWKLTVTAGKFSFTKKCQTLVGVKRALNSLGGRGTGWTEV